MRMITEVVVIMQMLWLILKEVQQILLQDLVVMFKIMDEESNFCFIMELHFILILETLTYT